LPPVITLPLKDGTEHPIFQTQVDEWVSLYQAVDVPQALRSMRGWLLANNTRRKTKSGIGRFIVRWLCRQQDKPHPGEPGYRGTGPSRASNITKTFDAIKRESTDAALRKTVERHRAQIAAAKPALPSGNGRPALPVGQSRPAIDVKPEKPPASPAPLDSTVIAPATHEVQVAVAPAPAKPVDVPVAAPAEPVDVVADVMPAKTPRFTFRRPPLPKDEAIAKLREQGLWPKEA